MQQNVEFANLQSRILLKPFFERQFIVPVPPPKPMEWMLRTLERTILKPDIGHIEIDRPIFLIGLPRSGTTMLQDIMASHEKMAYISNTLQNFETCFYAAEWVRRLLNLNVTGERYLGDSVIVDATSPNDSVLFWAHFMKRDLYSLDWPEHKPEDFTEAEIAERKDILRKIIRVYGNGEHRFFTKNPGLLTDVLTLQRFFPDAKFVHIVRDGRMNANSQLKLYRLEKKQIAKIDHPMMKDFIPYPRVRKLPQYVAEFGAEDIRCTAHVWNDAVTFVNEVKDRLNAFYEVRYEDILANPKEELFKIFDFCELPPPSQENRKFWDKLANVGKTHHKNTYGDFEVVEEICRANLERYGYL